MAGGGDGGDGHDKRRGNGNGNGNAADGPDALQTHETLAAPAGAGRAADPGNAPPGVLELAGACARFVEARYGVALDFDPDTLSLLDQWVRDARDEAADKPEVAQLVQSAAGAYLGEVIRRQFGGFWDVGGSEGSPTLADVAEWRLQLAPAYCSFNPIGMVREALFLEPQDGWHAHFELDPAEAESIEARLAALPEVEEDDYYAPSTRYDVVCIVIDALRDGLRARGLGDVTFGPEDYDRSEHGESSGSAARLAAPPKPRNGGSN
jgi:hypothetical protein